ncbi:MAG: glutathione S-transferase family protein [Pseudomonadota bacterium]
MTLKVLEHPLSPYAQKVKLALHFKSLDFQVETPMIGAGTDDFLTASPRGEVPVLLHDTLAIYDSAVIGAYIEETWPEPMLLPQSATARVKSRLIEDAMDTHFESNTWGLGEILIFNRAQDAQREQMHAYAEQQIQGWYQWLEPQLSEAGWFNGSRYGWTDICVIPFVNGAGRFDILPERNTRLALWLEQINAREDVAAVTSQAQAAELDPTMMQAAINAGFKREYRDHRLEWMIQAGGIDIVKSGIEQNNIRFNGAFPTEGEGR